MRTDTGQVFRLEDYRPSPYLIPETDLTFRLSPEATVVVAKLTVERRDDTPLDAPLALDGDGLTLKRLEIDGVAADPAAFAATPDGLVIAKPPQARRFQLTIETRDRAGQQPGADGPLPLERRLLHAMRGRRLPPHHLFPRPAGHPFGLQGPHRGRRQGSAAAAVQRQSGRGRRACRRPPLRRLARPVPEAVLPVRAGGRRSRRAEGRVRHHVRPQGRRSASMSSTARRRARPTRWTR